MNVLKQNNNIYDDLKSLLRLSIAGIFIVASLNYLFDTLFTNLEKQTENRQLEINILKKVKQDTLEARYDFSKLSSFLPENLFQYYQTQALEKIQISDQDIQTLKFGGKIRLGYYDSAHQYTVSPDTTNLPILSEDLLYPTLQQSIQTLKEAVQKRNHSTHDLRKIQESIEAEINRVSRLLNSRIEKVDRTLNISRGKLIEITNEIHYKKLLYFYLQIFTYLFIIFSLIMISKPISRHIIQTNQELEEMNKEAKKMAVRAKQASKSKSEFLANMSHEIRTPLNAILGFIDLLKEKETDSEKIQYIKTIQSSSVALLGIINDILDFSKIESGNLEIDKIDFNVHDEFQTLVELFKSKASEKSISLVLNMDPHMPSALHSDPLRIKQVMANLISNALKFTPRNGKVVLNIRYDNQHQKLLVSISDNGIGIPEEKQKHIFKPFSQAESSTTRKYGGTGLGLTISSRLVSMLGGTLKLKSKEGEGSTFSFEVDAKVGEYKSELREKAVDLSEAKGSKILLVEDNKANQMFMSLILKKFGFEYEIANDGLEAIKAFENHHYDLILMDENMPNLNGIEATKTILKLEKERGLTHTPIVALTANALKGDREKFIEAGMDEYLTKPVSKEKLAKVFEQFLLNQETA